MFNTTIHTVTNQDMEIAKEKMYNARLDSLGQQVRDGVSPANMTHARGIAQEFQDTLIVNYVNIDNSAVNFAVYQNDCLGIKNITASFKLNGHQITIPIDEREICLKECKRDIVNYFTEEIASAIASKIIPQLINEFGQVYYGKQKGAI